MEKVILLVCLFYCFLRLQICEPIAAIFWQSPSYVFSIVDNFASFLYHIAAFGSLAIADCVDSSFDHVQSSLLLSKIARKKSYF